MASPQRRRRVADQIQRELAQLLAGELRDPRLALLTITEVELSPDLEHATVFYSTLSGAAGRAPAELALERASGLMRSALARRLKLRVAPDLRFRFDPTLERGMALDRLIDQALGRTDAGEPPAGAAAPDESGTGDDGPTR